MILEYLFAISTVAVGWSGYVVSFLGDFGIAIPSALSATPFDYVVHRGWQMTGTLINFPAVLIIAVLTVLVSAGMRQSATVNRVIVVIKSIAVLLFIGFGIKYVQAGNWSPLIPPNQGEFGIFGWSGVLRGAAVVFFAYIGFDAVSTAAQETRNPQRDMPIGILLSLGICTVLYILVSLVLTGIVRYDRLGVPDPIAVGLNSAGPALFWLRPIVKVGAIAGLSSVILVQIMAQSRIFFAMSNDRLLPGFFLHNPSPMPDTSAVHCRDWLGCHAFCRVFADRCFGRAGFYRHPLCVCDCMRERDGASPDEARPAEAIQGPFCPGHSLVGGRSRFVSDDRASLEHLGEIYRLVRSRPVDLFFLCPEAKPVLSRAGLTGMSRDLSGQWKNYNTDTSRS